MSLKQLLLGLAATFALPWFFLIVRPYAELAQLKPVAYDEEAGDEATGYFPPARSSSESRGEKIYIAQGCIQCHSQVIRPQYIGGDGDEYKQGWGAAQESLAPAYTRQTTPYDYLGSAFAPIGHRRYGPDLANAGYRFKNRQEVLTHLYSPQAEFDWSNCPPQRHLFTKKKKQGQGSKLAVHVNGPHAPAPDEEILPKDDALALADYILGLKRDAVLPVALGGVKPAPASSTAPAAPASAPAAP